MHGKPGKLLSKPLASRPKASLLLVSYSPERSIWNRSKFNDISFLYECEKIDSLVYDVSSRNRLI
jgi:hypothetical protein